MKYKNLHEWLLEPKKAIEVQKSLKNSLKIQPFEKEVNIVAGVDIAFKGNFGVAVIIVIDKNFQILEIKYHFEKVNMPYIPGLLAFREGPIFLKAWEKIENNVDIVFFDGQGIAHPRKLGIASHMGLFIDKPTIGIAKSKLVGEYEEPAEKKGSFTNLVYKNETIGIVYRSKDKTKPIFISPGHMIDIPSSLKFTQMFITKYRLPEPTRLAHIYTQKIKKEKLIG
ncbi:MAG: deoxyribonuclease [Thermosipho sp. (in: thermotogales)]|nr:deoxyribonuclease [Thermosipho sp. (in: thermotogales)]MDN5324678.1 deoxyribonuclease [Thermosipho sp. (in: thermotogales)]